MGASMKSKYPIVVLPLLFCFSCQESATRKPLAQIDPGSDNSKAVNCVSNPTDPSCVDSNTQKKRNEPTNPVTTDPTSLFVVEGLIDNKNILKIEAKIISYPVASSSQNIPVTYGSIEWSDSLGNQFVLKPGSAVAKSFSYDANLKDNNINLSGNCPSGPTMDARSVIYGNGDGTQVHMALVSNADNSLSLVGPCSVVFKYEGSKAAADKADLKSFQNLKIVIDQDIAE